MRSTYFATHACACMRMAMVQGEVDGGKPCYFSDISSSRETVNRSMTIIITINDNNKTSSDESGDDDYITSNGNNIRIRMVMTRMMM